MADNWETPDVAADGSMQGDGAPPPDDHRSSGWRRRARRARHSLAVQWRRQRNAAWTLVQASGFAAFLFGAFRLFGLGYYGMGGLGPFSREFFTTVYIPGPWAPTDVFWDLAWLWMFIGVVIVAASTRQRR